MAQPLNQIDAITLFVEDPQRSKAFYERVFGVPSIYEDEHSAVIKLENTILNFLVTSQAPGLIEPAPVAEASSGSRFQFTVGVDDVDTVCSALAAAGVELLNGPQDRPWGVRTAAFADPDGHVWEVAQQLAG